MRSPFAAFREHQKVLMVVVVGLSMIGFVLLGAVPDPSNMPRGLVAIVIVAAIAGAAWIAGMPSKRSAEYGTWGMILGAALAVAFTVFGGPPPALRADSGNLSREELQDLRLRHQAANRFIGEAISATRTPQEARYLAQQYEFSYGRGGDQDVVTTELLRREAERLGLHASDDSVTAFIKEITDNKMTSSQFRTIRLKLGLSEEDLYDVLAAELEARTAAEFLFDFRQTPALPPEQYWEFYRQMYVKQKAEVARVPVEEFIDESESPSSAELTEFFHQHRNNYPNLTPQRQLLEGNPGFFQPRRVQLAYLEAVFDDFKSTEPVTDKEIRERYEEEYVKPAQAAAARVQPPGGETPSGPALPDAPVEGEQPEGSETPAGETPAETPSAGPGATPDSETPEASTPEAAAPEESPTPGGGGTPEPAATETPAPASEPQPEEPAEPATTDPAAPQAALGRHDETEVCQTESEGESTSAEDVADDPASPEAGADPTEPAAEPSESSTDPAAPDEAPTGATDEPAASPETPAGGTEPAADPGSDEDRPADAAGQPATGAIGIADPAAPTPNIPLLDAALKEQIRIDIQSDRTHERLLAAARQASDFVQDKIGYLIHAPENDPSRIDAARAVALLKRYAAENGLHYAETPLLSGQELQTSEDHPVGAAVTVGEGRQMAMPNAVFQTGAQDTYRPIIARNPVTDSWFAAWKLNDVEEFSPENFDDPRIKEQVLTAWRQLKARGRAEARAAELARIVTDSGKSLGEALGEKTVREDDGSSPLVIAETGDFYYRSIPGVPQPQPFSYQPPEIQNPGGVEKAGPDFMETVFNDLAPGETGVAPAFDRSIYYVVRIMERSPAGEEESAAFRQRFLQQPVFEQFYLPSVYQMLAMQTAQEYQTDWVEDLFKKHQAQLLVDPRR